MNFTSPMEPGHILAFSRVLGDPNRLHADVGICRESRSGGIAVPPTYPLLLR
jgi:acyl dehydratase